MKPELRVMSAQCSTCVFGPDSAVSPARFRELRKQWEALGNERFQICHHSAVGTDEEPPDSEDIVMCRGWYDEQYLKRGNACSIVQVAERLGLLVEVDVMEYEQ